MAVQKKPKKQNKDAGSRSSKKASTIKPALSSSSLRRMKKKKPQFNPMNYGFDKHLKHRWRRPRGVANKKRARMKFAGASPLVGRRNAKNIRGLHPCGMSEVLIRNVYELAALTNGSAIRLSGQLGKRKKDELRRLAQEKGLHVVN